MMRRNLQMICRKVILLSLLTCLTCVYADPYSSVEEKLEGAMRSMCVQGIFSGAILIAVNDKVILKQACGLANRDFNISNTINTKFNLGSLGKLFTSVAIAQLIQQDKISLSTPIYKIIPTWLPTSPNVKTITVGQLLTHSAGFGNFMQDQRWKEGADSGLYNEVKDYKPLVSEDKILFTAGTSQSYSNNGYVLLGAIIEAVTHTGYVDYLGKNIFKPAAMGNTGIWSLDETIPNRAEGYYQVCAQNKCHWKNNNFEAPFKGSPAGGAYSTVEDLFRFSRSLHQSKLFTKELSLQLLSTDIVSSSNALKIKFYKINDIEIPENYSPYGFAGAWNKFGFAVWENPLLVGYTGGIQGASAFFATSPDGKYTIIILSNISGSGPIKLYMKIRKILGFSTKITNY